MTNIVMIGAGSIQFGVGLIGDIFQSNYLTGSNIVLHDINHQATERTRILAQDQIDRKKLDFNISNEPNLKKALKNADFVIISIEVGDRFALWKMDWEIPLRYSITQIYGENGGPGGLFHSLRIIPPILDICEQIENVCPDAVVFNYSNPMSRICSTVHRRFPELKFIGMCHEIASLNRCLPHILNRPIEDIEYRAAGLNHFSVLTEVKDKWSGTDIYPEVLKNAPEFFNTLPGFSEILAQYRVKGNLIETEGWMEVDLENLSNQRAWSDRRLFKIILDKFGYLPITTDSHFGEYIQWAHDCSDTRGIADFFEYYSKFLTTQTPKFKDEVTERVVPIINGIISNSGYEEYAVNIPNRNYIDCLPGWIAVEVPAIVTKKDVSGIKINNLKPGFKGLLTNQIGIHDLTASAVLAKSRELAIQALLVDPVVTRYHNIADLVDYFIAAQSPWLDYLK